MAQQQQSDNTNDALLIGGFVLALLVVFYIFFGNYIVAAHLWLREMWLKLILAVFQPLALQNAQQMIEGYNIKEWDLRHLNVLSGVLRLYLFPPFALVFVWYARRIYKNNPTRSLRNVYTPKTLVQSQVHQWPWVAPVKDLDLVNAPIHTGPWAMAKTPVAFAKENRLLNGKVVETARAEKLFATQLGRLWEGPDRLRPYIRGLYACFIAQLCRNKTGARDGLATLALGMASGKVDYAFADALLAKHGNDERVTSIVKKHAYVSTVMWAVLEEARACGVLPPNYFLWLRPLYRPMWYAMVCVGKRTSFAEVAGIHAHYLAEVVAKHAIATPYVIEAVKALEKALDEVVFD